MDAKLKHLEFIQNIITRMNTSSFMIKGWSVTLVSALFALAADKANLKFAIIAYLPVAMFWALDGFFLAQERRYRMLYNVVATKPEATATDFSLDASGYDKNSGTWRASVFSKTLFPFHGTLLLVVSIATFVIPSFVK